MDSIVNIEKFRQSLVDVINNAGVTVAIGYYVVKDIYRDLEKVYQDTLKEELTSSMESTETMDVPLIQVNDVKEEEEENETN